MWVSVIELRSSGLHTMCLYLLGHLVGTQSSFNWKWSFLFWLDSWSASSWDLTLFHSTGSIGVFVSSVGSGDSDLEPFTSVANTLTHWVISSVPKPLLSKRHSYSYRRMIRYFVIWDSITRLGRNALENTGSIFILIRHNGWECCWHSEAASQEC